MSSKDFDWSHDRRLQFMLKLDYAVLVDPRTPVRSGIGSVAPTPRQTPAAKSLAIPSTTPRGGAANNGGRPNILNLSTYCIYIKWGRGKNQSGKFAPLPLGGSKTRDDGRINVVFPPADTNYEFNFSADFGSSTALDQTKKLTLSAYILRFDRTAVDPLWPASQRTDHFRTEFAANQLTRTTVVDGLSSELTGWLRQTKSPSRRRQMQLKLSPYGDLLVLDFAILRGDDIAPATIQMLPFDDRSVTPAAAPPSAVRRPAAADDKGKKKDDVDAVAAGEGGSAPAAATAVTFDTIVSDPDIRPGMLIPSRSDIFQALSGTIGQAVVDAKTSITVTHLLSIFETGNRAVLKLPGLSPDAAFSLLLSNDSPFMETFHEKRKDRGFIPGPWKELPAAAAAVSAGNRAGANLARSVRVRITGGEMRLGGKYFEAKEHSFLVAYQLPTDPPGATNYVGHFHLQGSGMASAARVELAIHVGHGIFDSITAAPAPAAAAASFGDSDAQACTVHFAMAVVFSSPTIEGRFRSKADAMIPKMLNALSTTARALLGADDLSRAAEDKETEEQGRKFLRRHEARVSVDPLMALRPYSMKSNPCIVQHFLRLATEQETNNPDHQPMAPRPANLELIASILTMHLKHESIVSMAVGILSRCLGRHGRTVITRCPGLSDAVERARRRYDLPFLLGACTTLDQTVEQLLAVQVNEDIDSVGVWKVLDGKSRVSRLAGSESSFFMGDIHRVRVTLPALRKTFTNGGKQFGALASVGVTPQAGYIHPGGSFATNSPGAASIASGSSPGALATLQLQPTQVQILIALLSLHLNERAVVDTVTYCLERTATDCLVENSTLRFLLLQNVWSLYPEFRPRLEHLRSCFSRFEDTLKPQQKEFTKKYGGAALCDGEAVFQTKIMLYEPVEEEDCDLILTRKTVYIGSMAFPIEHLYTVARTKVYWLLPAVKIVSQKPRVVVAAAPPAADAPLFEPLKDELAADEEDTSLLEGNKILDDAFRDLDASVAANFGAAFGDDLLIDGGAAGAAYRGGGGNGNDVELGVTAPFSGGVAAAERPFAGGRGAARAAAAAQENSSNQAEVAVTYLCKCWDVDGFFSALRKLDRGGTITTD